MDASLPLKNGHYAVEVRMTKRALKARAPFKALRTLLTWSEKTADGAQKLRSFLQSTICRDQWIQLGERGQADISRCIVFQRCLRRVNALLAPSSPRAVDTKRVH